MTDPPRQEALTGWLREHLLGYMPTRAIHDASRLYEPDDLAGCVEDLAALADAGLIGDAPGSAGPLGHRWRVNVYVAMTVTVRLPVSGTEHDPDALVQTLRDVIDIPSAEIVYDRTPAQIRIGLRANGAGMFGALQAAQEILTVLYHSLRLDCASPADAELMALRAFLERAYHATVQVTAA